MIDSASLPGFIVVALVVLIIPGPGVLYIIARSLSQGQRAGLISVLGLSTGALFQVAAATIGLSAILLTSATAFNIIKLLGAAYLIYLGIRTLFARHAIVDMELPEPLAPIRLFVDGIIISVFNPKIAVFFLAFLPQFISPDTGSIPQQIFLLGILYVAMALITDASYAILAGQLRLWLGSKIIQGPLPRYSSGLIYLALGISTALTERR